MKPVVLAVLSGVCVVVGVWLVATAAWLVDVRLGMAVVGAGLVVAGYVIGDSGGGS